MSSTQKPQKQLLWSQRLALIRHHLHIAHRTRDFGFFRALQVQTLISDTDHTSLLASVLNASTNDQQHVPELTNSNRNADAVHDADVVISSLDKLAAVIANLYEDAFKSLCNHIRTVVLAQADQRLASEDQTITDGYHEAIDANARQHATYQRNQAEAGIDKMLDSAVVLITHLPSTAQLEASAVLIQSLAFVADAMSICLVQMDRIEHIPHDNFQLESAAETVSRVVAQAVSAMKGVFGLMSSAGESNQQPAIQRQIEIAASEHDGRRKSSTFGDPGAFARGWARRLSSALTQSSSSDGSLAGSRKGSVVPSAAGLQQWIDQHHRHETSSLATSERTARAESLPELRPRSVRLSSGIARELAPLPATPSSSIAPMPDTDTVDRDDLAHSTPSLVSPNKTAFETNSLQSKIFPNRSSTATPFQNSNVINEEGPDPFDTTSPLEPHVPATRRGRNSGHGTSLSFVLPSARIQSQSQQAPLRI